MILYLGDGDMSGAAAYLSGVMLHHNIPFERVDSSDSPPEDLTTTWYDGYILSDYPAQKFLPGQLEHLRDAVSQGAGLLMIGGWESFYGQNGEYDNTVLAEMLPVKMQNKDDRRDFSQSPMVFQHHHHPILEGLPWDRPAFIGGFNQFDAKPDAEVLLKALCFRVRIVDEDEVVDVGTDSVYNLGIQPLDDRLSIPLPSGKAAFLSLMEDHPLLVVGKYGKGRTAAFASDVAPHWVGGMIDWGKKRMTQKLADGGSIEVGEDYAKFFAQLVRWVGEK